MTLTDIKTLATEINEAVDVAIKAERCGDVDGVVDICNLIARKAAKLEIWAMRIDETEGSDNNER